MRKASGDNFTIDLEHGVAVVRIYRRSDLPVSVTDALADALLLKAKTLTLANDVTGIVLDLRRLEGPVSPRVEEIYGELCAMWESTGQPIALLAGSVVQRMQLGRLLSEHAPRFGGLF